MGLCEHTEWLQIVARHDSGFSLQVTRRAKVLLKDLKDSPSLILLLGAQAKAAAVQTLLPNESCGGADLRRRQVQLWSHSTILPGRSTIIADSDLMPRRFANDTPFSCHHKVNFDVNQVAPNLETVSPMDTLFSRVLCPLAEVICVFLADYEESMALICHLASWSDGGPTSTLPAAANPQLLLVADKGDQRQIEMVKALRSAWRSRSLGTAFSKLSVMYLPGARLLRRRILLKRLGRVSYQVRLIRKREYHLFSATHLAVFWSQAIDRLKQPENSPFDFIQASRSHRPVLDNLAYFLSEFLSDYGAVSNVVTTALPIIASSLLKDHYLPEMHVFRPQTVFRALYASACYDAFSRAGGRFVNVRRQITPAQLVLLTEQKFVGLVKVLVADPTLTAASIHLKNVQRVPGHWVRTTNPEFCPLCIQRRTSCPPARCGHRICEACLQLYSDRSEADPWRFDMPTCLLCGTAPAFPESAESGIRIQPDTAQSRLLCIDGGGNRAVIPITALMALEAKLGIPQILHHAFDMAMGTSSGGLIVLSLFINGWSSDQCLESLNKLAREAFPPWAMSTNPIIAVIQQIALSVLAGSIYPSIGIENVLKAAFSKVQNLDDVCLATWRGIRVAVPFTTVPGNAACFLSNYNGMGARADCGYEFIHAPAAPGRLTTWKVARAITAAPGYLTACHFEDIGLTCQDGATWKNMLGWPILYENQVIKHETTGESMPDIEPAYLLSLGTGYAKQILDRWQDRDVDGMWSLPLRLWDFVSTHFHGGRSWCEFALDHHVLDDKKKLFRLDVEFADGEPNLDNVDQMADMQAMAAWQFQKSPEIDELAKQMVVNMFYFELTRQPDFDMAEYTVEGQVLSRWKSSEDDFGAWAEYVHTSRIRVFLGGQYQGPLLPDAHGNLTRDVKTSVRSLEEEIVVQIQVGGDAPRHLGGSPFPIERLAKVQGFDEQQSAFGRTKGVKRACEAVDDTPASKRRRQC